MHPTVLSLVPDGPVFLGRVSGMFPPHWNPVTNLQPTSGPPGWPCPTVAPIRPLRAQEPPGQVASCRPCGRGRHSCEHQPPPAARAEARGCAWGEAGQVSAHSRSRRSVLARLPPAAGLQKAGSALPVLQSLQQWVGQERKAVPENLGPGLALPDSSRGRDRASAASCATFAVPHQQPAGGPRPGQAWERGTGAREGAAGLGVPGRGELSPAAPALAQLSHPVES